MDQATHTVYVGNGNDNTVSVINAASCSAQVSSGCDQVPASVNVGVGPVFDAVNQFTDTIYVVALGSNTVSVINGATCNASVTTGCSHAPATVTVGDGPDGIAIDPATDTIYVANSGPDNDGTGDTVSVINGATCNGQVTSGCGQTPATITVGLDPAVPAFNPVTRTLYVPDANPGAEGLVSVVDAKTCNAEDTAGCGQTPPTVSVGFNTFPVAIAVDPTTNTAYETAFGASLGSVYVIDGRHCNASVSLGCGQSPHTVSVGSGPTDVVVDPLSHQVLVVNQEDSTVSVLDGNLCNAFRTAGCGQHAPAVTTGFSPGSYLDVDLATSTIYVAVAANVSVLDGAGCTLSRQTGCRHAAPTTTVGNGPSFTAVDRQTDTVYVTNQEDGTVSVINGATCNVVVRIACGQPSPTVAVGAVPKGIAVDEQTDTVYVGNAGSGTVSVIDGATCNAGDHAGCSQVAATVVVGVQPDQLTVDEATNTIYVANNGSNTVSVIDGVTCNATDRSGCGNVQTIPVGRAPYGIAVNQRDNTVYVANVLDDTLSVLNGSRCDAETTVGCGDAVPVVAAGTRPGLLAVDQVTDTVYVADGFFDFLPTASVAVVDGASCNGVETAGCSQTPRFMTTGGTPVGLAVDQATDTIYVTSINDSDTNIFNGSTCNSVASSGCGQTPVKVPTGGWSAGVALNPRTHTVYVADNVDGELSFF